MSFLKTRNILLDNLRKISLDVFQSSSFSHFEFILWMSNDPLLAQDLQQALNVSIDPGDIASHFEGLTREAAVKQSWTAMIFSRIMDIPHMNYERFRSLFSSAYRTTPSDDDGFIDFEYIDIQLTEAASEDLEV